MFQFHFFSILSLDDDDLDGESDGSVSLDGEDDEGSDIFEDESDEEGMEVDSDEEVSDPDEPKSDKIKPISGKEFQRKLKNTDSNSKLLLDIQNINLILFHKKTLSDMDSLFAAAEDFSEMLEETGKVRNHGTLDEMFNQDKSSEKQLDWEEKRLQKRGGQRRFKPKTKSKGKPQMKPKISQGQRKRGEISKKSKPSFKKNKK